VCTIITERSESDFFFQTSILNFRFGILIETHRFALAMSNVTTVSMHDDIGVCVKKAKGKKEKEKGNKERKIVQCNLRICVGHIASKIWSCGARQGKRPRGR
jgi:hypothetical protein